MENIIKQVCDGDVQLDNCTECGIEIESGEECCEACLESMLSDYRDMQDTYRKLYMYR